MKASGRKVLFKYIVHRSHMSIAALEILNARAVIVYALSPHTSGTTQSLFVGVFGPWKTCYCDELRKISASDERSLLDEWTLPAF